MALLAEYGFSEGSGPTTADTSGNSRNASATGSPWNPGGKNGFGAKASESAFFTAPTLPGASSWTIMFWYKWDGTAPVNPYGQFFHPSNDAYWLEQLSTGEIIWNIGARVSTPTAGVWGHVAVVVTGETVQTYWNGSPSGGGSGGTALPSGVTFQIGTGYDGPAPGVIDELRVFDTALTAADISTWMGTPVGGGGSSAVTGAVSSSTTVAGAVAARRVATGAVVSASTVAGAVTTGLTVTGAVTTGSSTAGAVTASRPATGTVTSTTTVTGVLSTPDGLTGAVTSTTEITGRVTSRRVVTGAVLSQTTVTGSLTQPGGVSGSVTSTTAVTGTTQVARGARGSVESSTFLTGSPGFVGSPSGSVTTISSARGAIDARFAVSGTVISGSSVSGQFGTDGVHLWLGDHPVTVRIGDYPALFARP